MTSLREALNECAHVVVLQKCISSYICARPDIPGPSSAYWSNFFVYSKSWQLCPYNEVVPLITKRRTEAENFFLLHSDSRRRVFAKIVDECTADEQYPTRISRDIVIYQVLPRVDGIYIDICMEACRSTFHPFHAKHSGTSFSKLFETIKNRDTDCSRNIHSRSSLIATLNQGPTMPVCKDYHDTKLADDVLRFIRMSTRIVTELRFFNTAGSGSANKHLCWLTMQHLTAEACSIRATRLNIDENKPILNSSGLWFTMMIDRDALSVICLEAYAPTQDDSEISRSIRPLTFFTARLNDMYPRSDELEAEKSCGDSKAVDDQSGVSKIAEEIQLQHAKHYARACYCALRDNVDPIMLLQSDDIAYALSALSFRESLTIFVPVGDLSASSPSTQPEPGISLWAAIGNQLRIVPGSNDQIFFYHGDVCDPLDELPFKHAPQNSVNCNQDGSREAISADKLQSNDEIETGSPLPNFHDPPLFFRLRLDGKLANLTSILELKKSAILVAEVSTNSSSAGVLPLTHVVAVSKLHNALISFAAEQKLEQFRCMGRSLTEEICREAMLYLPKTSHKSCEMVLEFFSFKSDSLLPAPDSVGGNENGFKILFNEFDKSSTFTRVGQDTFLAYDKSTMMDVLPYWCFVQIRKPMGIVVVQVHHPLGENSSEEQLQAIQGVVQRICDRTNQLLLLDSLFRTKTASSLLIHIDDEENLLDAGNKSDYTTYFCPVQHTATIPLHRRCAPQQSILALETTILQNFIVTNRRGVFVYKDELENVFYMKLRWFRVSDAKDTDRNPNAIELSVYGCEEPGPSITDHLVCLLKKKLLNLTLEALSSLLKKNPW